MIVLQLAAVSYNTVLRDVLWLDFGFILDTGTKCQDVDHSTARLFVATSPKR